MCSQPQLLYYCYMFQKRVTKTFNRIYSETKFLNMRIYSNMNNENNLCEFQQNALDILTY